MWAKRDNGADVSQARAASFCRSLDLAGFRDWRLPVIAELRQIYGDTASGGPGIYDASGPYKVKGGITLTGPFAWSSSKVDSENTSVFFFAGGMQMSSLSVTPGPRALCVRGPEK
jgi:hypothetical protein